MKSRYFEVLSGRRKRNGTAENIEPWSEEYLALLTVKRIPAESLRNMPVDMHLIKIRPETIDFLNSFRIFDDIPFLVISDQEGGSVVQQHISPNQPEQMEADGMIRRQGHNNEHDDDHNNGEKKCLKFTI